jgi:hypothetical protein
VRPPGAVPVQDQGPGLVTADESSDGPGVSLLMVPGLGGWPAAALIRR